MINIYLKHNKNLTPLHGKKPLLPEWNNKTVSLAELKRHHGNFGWVLTSEDMIIDIDPRNGGDNSIAKLFEKIGKLEYTVKTAGGGHHIYLQIKKGYDKYFYSKKHTDYPGIEFLTKGSQAVVAGSRTEQGEYSFLNGFQQGNCPIELLSILKRELTLKNIDDDDWLLSVAWTPSKVKELLSKLDPSMPNDEWVKFGMALHSWDKNLGLSIWEAWSMAGDNYKAGETTKRWSSFKKGAITMGTLVHKYDEALGIIKDDALGILKLQLQKCTDEKELKTIIIPRIKTLKLNRFEVEKFAIELQNKYKELIKIKMPIAEMRKDVSPKIEATVVDDKTIPVWCKKWVYVNSHSGYFNSENLTLHKTESFNVENGQHVPVSQFSDVKTSASKYVTDRGFVKKADIVIYLPSFKQKFLKFENKLVLNRFDANSIPKADSNETTESIKAIATLTFHLKFLCKTTENANLLTQWLAHNVQYPGKLIKWAPVIQSIEGVGKNVLGDILTLCLGHSNVGWVAPKNVMSNHDTWATNKIVNVLDEIRISGRNRYDVVNQLKPLITNPYIQINPKGVDQYTVHNVTNYICFTNFKDSLPLRNDDRRWWVIFSPVESLDDMPKHVGEKHTTYYDKIFHILQNFGPHIRHWLLTYKISEEFLKIKQAPMTDDKTRMILTEETSMEGYVELKDILEESKNNYYNNQIILPVKLFDYFTFKYSEICLSNKSKNLLLKRLGFMLNPYKYYISNMTYQVWTKNSMSKKEINNLLEFGF